MGRTIALKLSKNEEQIVAQLNKQGITNSELLRNALRRYLEFLHQTTALNTDEKTKMSFPKETFNMLSVDSVSDLKNEIEAMQSSTKKTQKEIQQEISRLHQMISDFCIDAAILQKRSEETSGVKADVHWEIDAFLEQQEKHASLWKKQL